jgi:hypothetical protein
MSWFRIGGYFDGVHSLFFSEGADIILLSLVMVIEGERATLLQYSCEPDARGYFRYTVVGIKGCHCQYFVTLLLDTMLGLGCDTSHYSHDVLRVDRLSDRKASSDSSRLLSLITGQRRHLVLEKISSRTVSY